MDEIPDQGAEMEPESKGKFPFSIRKIGEFLANTLRLERDVTNLKEKVKKLEVQVSAMQRQADEQSGQMKQLGAFVHSALNERIDARAEQAAMHLFKRLLVLQEPPAPPKLPRAKQSKPKQP